MKVKTSELTGAALDWAVAKCEQATGKNIREGFGGFLLVVDEHDFGAPARYSTDWAQGGPIIEHQIARLEDFGEYWEADCGGFTARGPTPLVAAMHCYVTSKMGDEIDVPEELL